MVSNRRSTSSRSVCMASFRTPISIHRSSALDTTASDNADTVTSISSALSPNARTLSSSDIISVDGVGGGPRAWIVADGDHIRVGPVAVVVLDVFDDGHPVDGRSVFEKYYGILLVVYGLFCEGDPVIRVRVQGEGRNHVARDTSVRRPYIVPVERVRLPQVYQGQPFVTAVGTGRVVLDLPDCRSACA